MSLIMSTRRACVIASLVAVLACSSDDDDADVSADASSGADAQAVDASDQGNNEPEGAGEPGASSGGRAGSTSENMQGAPGSEPGVSCGRPATDVRGDGCSDSNPATLMAALAPTLLDEGGVPIATSANVTYQDAASGDAITITFTIAGTFNADALSIVRAGPNQSTSERADVKTEVHGQDVTITVKDGGTYTLIEAIKPANGCGEKTISANVDASSNENLSALAGVTHLIGNISLKGTVSDLSAFKCLTVLDGSLEATASPMLTQIAMPWLVRIQGRVRITGLRGLTDLVLPKLRAVGRGTDGASLYLNQLPALKNVDIRNLVDAAGDVSLGTLGAMGDAPLTLHVDALTTLGGTLTLSTLKTLQNLRGFSGLSDVAGNFILDNTDALTTLLGLARLGHVGGQLSLKTNRGMFSAALDGLRSVGGNIVIADHPFVTSIDLPALTTLGSKDGTSLSLTTMPKLTAFNARALSKAAAQLSFSRLGDTADAPLALRFDELDTLQGDLTLTTLKTLETLDGFGKLSHIQGALSITACDKLATLGGLAKLAVITGPLSLENNKALSAAILPELNKLEGGLHAKDDPVLTTIELSALNALGSSDDFSIELSGLPMLTTLAAKNLGEMPAQLSLTRIGDKTDSELRLDFGALTTLHGGLTVSTVKTLRTLAGFPKLITLDGDLDINGTTQLAAVADLPALATIGGQINLANNMGMTAVTLEALTSLNAGLTAMNNAALTSIDLHALTKVGSNGAAGASNQASFALTGLPKLTLLDVGAITEIPGQLNLMRVADTAAGPLELKFGALTTLHGGIALMTVGTLENLEGFAELTRIDGDLSINRADRLTTLTGMSKLTHIDGQLSVDSNAKLSEVTFEALTEVGGRVYFNNDTALASIDLHALEHGGASSGFSMSLMGLPKLLHVDAQALVDADGQIGLNRLGDAAAGPLMLEFAALTSVRGTLTLTALKTLQNVDGFAKLSSITGTLTITSNPALTSVMGFKALTQVSGSVQVTGNTALSMCQARQFAQTLKPMGSSGGFSVTGNRVDDSCSMMGQAGSGGGMNSQAGAGAGGMAGAAGSGSAGMAGAGTGAAGSGM